MSVPTTVPTTSVSTPKPATAPVAQSTLTSQVAKANLAAAVLPPGMGLGKSTLNLESLWMRALLYGETNARKTTSAAFFGPPEDVRIIETRSEDQLIPLAGLNYKYELCDTAAKVRFAMMYPEKLWPEWAERPNRVLVIDDFSKIKDLILEDNELSDKGAKQNNMLVHRESKSDLAAMTKSLFQKPMHVIGTAFAQSYENQITHEENVGPDLPPSMNRMLTADFTFVFYLDKARKMFRTSDFRETYTDVDESMKKKDFTRITLAKNKIPAHLANKNIINDLEPMDLRKVWEKVVAASKQTAVVTVPK